jgi:hypothetical protein
LLVSSVRGEMGPPAHVSITVSLVAILPIIQLKVGECVREYVYELMIRSPAIESPFSP